jgi:hypothetical protein
LQTLLALKTLLALQTLVARRARRTLRPDRTLRPSDTLLALQTLLTPKTLLTLLTSGARDSGRPLRPGGSRVAWKSLQPGITLRTAVACGSAVTLRARTAGGSRVARGAHRALGADRPRRSRGACRIRIAALALGACLSAEALVADRARRTGRAAAVHEDPQFAPTTAASMGDEPRNARAAIDAHDDARRRVRRDAGRGLCRTRRGEEGEDHGESRDVSAHATSLQISV